MYSAVHSITRPSTQANKNQLPLGDLLLELLFVTATAVVVDVPLFELGPFLRTLALNEEGNTLEPVDGVLSTGVFPFDTGGSSLFVDTFLRGSSLTRERVDE